MITAFEFKRYRKILNLLYTEHRTNKSIPKEIVERTSNHDTLLSITKHRNLGRFGHVPRHPNTLSMASIIVHGRAPHKRGKRRLRKAWITNVAVWTTNGQGCLLSLPSEERSAKWNGGNCSGPYECTYGQIRQPGRITVNFYFRFFLVLKKISSPAVLRSLITPMFVRLSSGNENQCYSLRTAYPIFLV